MPWNLPFAAEFAACCGKTRVACFLLHLYLIQGFSALINFAIYKTIKSNLVVASYGSVLLTRHWSLTQDNLRAHCFFNNSNLFLHYDDIFIINSLM